jgi:hypothetical protein
VKVGALGHVTKINLKTVAETIFESKPESKINLGMPKLRCLEDVEND